MSSSGLRAATVYTDELLLFYWLWKINLYLFSGSDSKKPKWSDFKKKRKELKQTRQLHDKSNYDLIAKSKQIWESVRR